MPFKDIEKRRAYSKTRRESEKGRLYNKEYMKEYHKIYRKSEKYKAYNKKYKQSAKCKEYEFKYHYGITLKQKDEMFAMQEGKCAICSIELKFVNNAHTDHCHKTNKIRGLLCGPCNRGLGMFKDNISLLLSSIEYLKKQS